MNTDEDPQFDGGTLLQVGEPGSKTNIDVGSRAAPTLVDWNNDGKRDLVVGALAGKVHIFINEGADSLWDFRMEQFAKQDGVDLVVPTTRSSPHIMDLDDDSKKDLLTGNTEGQLVLYSNVGSDEAPIFSDSTLVEADSIPINLPGLARSRPFVCDWTNDGRLDVLIGGSDGLVYLYQGVDETTAVSWEQLPSWLGVGHLLNAYPNPFNPSVIIPFVLTQAGRVTLSVYNLAGRRVAVLTDKVFAEGRHHVIWKGVDDRGHQVSSGIYFIQFDVDGTSSTGKAVLLR